MAEPLQIPGRKATIENYRKRGGRIAAVLPIHYPRALFRAFDILPVEVWGPPGIEAKDSRLQPYICSIARNALNFLFQGGLDVADVLVVPHTCDSLQGLGSILLDFVKPPKPVIPIYIPRGRRQSDVAFLAEEIQAVRQRLCDITGRAPSAEEFLECSIREERADQALSDLCARRCHLPIADIEFYRLARSREYLPAETFCDLAAAALAQAVPETAAKIPIVLSGIVIEPLTLLEKLWQKGATVAADDLACCGRRLYPAGQSLSPFERMAERIVYGPPDSTRGSPIEDRIDHIQGLVKRTGARGVVFYGIKFCEPEQFDLPELTRELQKKGVPSVAVEIDLSDPLSHQILTRIEAFLEMIA